MTVTHITPNNRQKPQDVTDHLQRVRPSGISTFVHPPPSPLLPTLPRCMVRPRTPTFANVGFIIIRANRRSGHIHLLTWRGHQSWTKVPNYQMLLCLVNWVNGGDCFKRSEQCGATPGHLAAQRLLWRQLLGDTEDQALHPLIFGFLYQPLF